MKRIRYRHLNDLFSIFMLPLMLFGFQFLNANVGDLIMGILLVGICCAFLIVISYKILNAKSPADLPGLLG